MDAPSLRVRAQLEIHYEYIFFTYFKFTKLSFNNKIDFYTTDRVLSMYIELCKRSSIEKSRCSFPLQKLKFELGQVRATVLVIETHVANHRYYSLVAYKLGDMGIEISSSSSLFI